jgi:hypothetical protein
MELKRSLVAIMVIAAATVGLCFGVVDKVLWERIVLGAMGTYYTLKTITDYLPANGKVIPK